jgi:hypothetical protein
MESDGKGHLRQQENCILRGEKGKFCGRIELYDASIKSQYSKVKRKIKKPSSFCLARWMKERTIVKELPAAFPQTVPSRFAGAIVAYFAVLQTLG